MKTLDATGYKIGEVRVIEGYPRIVKVGAFTDKNGEFYSQLKWYRLSGKEARKYMHGSE